MWAPLAAASLHISEEFVIPGGFHGMVSAIPPGSIQDHSTIPGNRECGS
jgi:hypothetical protein